MIIHIVRQSGWWEAFDENGRLRGTEQRLEVFRRVWRVRLHRGPNPVICDKEKLVKIVQQYMDQPGSSPVYWCEIIAQGHGQQSCKEETNMRERKDRTYYVEMNPEHPSIQDIRLSERLTRTQAHIAARDLSEQFRDYTLNLYQGEQYLTSYCRGTLRDIPPSERNPNGSTG